MTFENLTVTVIGNIVTYLIIAVFHLIRMFVQTRLKESDSFHRKP